ncbi:MAG: class I SAM-dependent RNA methyltransferase [Bacteroidales bacterium]|nr:class I SAM-dependent RNA methyltransferase [Bacteroidales bacterium]
MDTLLAKTLHGLEDVLKAELESMGATRVLKGVRSVSFAGDREMLYRANYCLRTALSILKPVHGFSLGKAKDLYNKSLEYPWEKIMGVGQTFLVVPVVNSSLFSHTGYPALVLKDAIVDRFRKKTGRRPSVDQHEPDLVFNCHINEKQVSISLDSSLIPLFKRSYRRYGSAAPLNEVLAAGIIMMSGWNMTSPLLDPMCGSGTIPIEAALMARRIPPGKFRKIFGFMNWTDYDYKLFEKIRKEEDAKIIPLPSPVYCRDISREQIRIARMNIRSAGLADDIQSGVDDFLTGGSQGNKYTIIMNPPYGERLEQANIEKMYQGIGERLKHGYPGSTAWLLSSSKEGIKNIGLKASQKYILYNGKLEVKLLRFDLYMGSMKKDKD